MLYFRASKGLPPYHRRLLCEALEARTLLSVGLAQVGVGSAVQAGAARQQTLADLPGTMYPWSAAQQAVSSAIGQDQSAYHAASAAAGVTLANPANGFTAQLQSGALHVSAGSDTWDMSLVGLGYGGAAGTMYSWSTVGTAKTSTDGNRVDCDYGTIDEWYVNGPGGLEQGFTIASPPPQSEASGSLTVELALGGSLTGTVNSAGDGLTLTGLDGTASLAYTGLSASDATGKTLPASLEVRDVGGHQDLLIHVNDAGAKGPITIDPFVQEAELTASDGAAGDDFGFSLAISGNTLVIASEEAAYVFTESGLAWIQVAELTLTSGSNSVAISGNTVVVGSEGAAYVFTEPASGWANMTPTAELRVPDSSAAISVAISGSTLVVGADSYQSAAYVFTESGSAWTQAAELTASGSYYFGYAVAINESGNTLVVGSTGAAYVFTGSGSAWTQVAKLTASDGGGEFGYSLAISGNTVVVGAPESGNGQAYVFTEPASGWANMTQTAELTASDGADEDYFGRSVAISGNTLVVGAIFATIGGNEWQGAAYLFTEPASGWANYMTQTAKLTASDGAAGDFFGYSVSISGDTLVVGAPYTTIGSNGSQGAAYVYATATTVAGVSSTQATGAYGAGTAIPIAVAFNEAVTVTGTPQLTLNDGAVVNYTGGSGTSTLTFTYTVAAGQNSSDLDYASTSALALNGGSIQDTAGNLTVLALPATGTDALATKKIAIDTTAPTVAAVSSTQATGAYGAGTAIPIAVTFSEAVTVTGTPQLTLNDGAVVNYASGSGASTLAFTYTVAAGQNTADLDYASTAALALNGGGIHDLAGNAAVLTLPATGTDGLATQKIVIDTTPRTVAGVSSTQATGAYRAGTAIPIAVTFSEAVNVSGTPQLTLNDGATANYASGSGTSTLAFTYTVAAGQNTADLDYASTAALTLNGGSIQDSAGNAAVLTLPATGTDGLATRDIVIDTTPPTVAGVSSTQATGAYGAGTAIPFAVTFSEAVTVTGTPQLTLNDGAVANYTGGSATSTLTFTYTVAAGQNSSDLDYASTAALALNGGSIQDAAGNAAVLTLPATGTDGLATRNIVIDTTPPAVAGVSPTAGPAAGGTTVTIAGTGFTGAMLVAFGSLAASSFTVNSAGTQITATSPAESAGAVNVTVVTPLGISPASSANQFTYLAPVTVTAVSPAAGPAAGGTTVTIAGTGFTGAMLVAFGSLAASSFTVNSATQITATSPAESAGAVNVTVVTPLGISPASSADQFNYLTALTVTPADWTLAGLTLTLGSDGNLHVYTTGTTTPNVVSPCPPASVTNIAITAPGSTAANLTINSTGDPIPAGGLTYSGGGGLIITGSGVVTLSGTDSYTGGTIVSAGKLLVKDASALPDGGSLTVGAGGTFIFAPSSAGASGDPSETTAAPGTTNVVASSPVLPAATAADVANHSTLGRNSQSPIVPPAALQPPQSFPAVALGIPAADRLVWSSMPSPPAPLPKGEGSYGDLAWLGQAANSSDNSDQQRKKDVAILALEAVFADYGQ